MSWYVLWETCQALLELCSTATVAAKVAVDVCIVQIKRVLSAEQLPPAAFNESAERAFHATETFVQVYQCVHILASSLFLLQVSFCVTVVQSGRTQRP